MSRPRSRQPWLHRLEIAVHGNVTCAGLVTGDIDAEHADEGGHGLFVDDRRVLGHLVLTVDGVPPVAVVASSEGATTECLLLARNVGDPGPDPTVEVRRDPRPARGRRWPRRRGHLRGPARRCAATSSSRRAATAPSCTTSSPGSAPAAPLPVTLVGDRRRRGATTATRRTSRRRAPTLERRARRPRPRRPLAGRRCRPAARSTPAPRRQRRRARRRLPSTPAAGVALVAWADVRVDSQDSRLARTVRHSLHRPAAPAAQRPPRPDRRLRGRRLALVPHPVRARLDLGGPDDPAVRHRPGPGDAAGAGPAPGDPRRRRGRRGAGQDPARGAAHDVRGPRHPRTCRRPTTARSTPRRCGSASCTTRGGGGSRTADVVALRPALDAALGWMRRSVEQSADGLIRYHDATGRGPGQPGLEGLRRRDAHGERGGREGPDRPRRDAGVRRRGGAGAADLLEARARRGRRAVAPVGRETGGAGAASASGSPSVAGRRYPRWPSTGRVDSSTALGSNMGHVLGTGLLDDLEIRARWPPRSPRPTCSARSASAPSRAATPRTTRSATTPARCGPTTPPSARTAWPGPVTPGRGGPVRDRPRRRRRGERLPLARAVRRRPGGRGAGAVPGELPPAGVGRGIRRPARLDGPRPAGRRARAGASRSGRCRPRRSGRCGSRASASAASRSPSRSTRPASVVDVAGPRRRRGGRRRGTFDAGCVGPGGWVGAAHPDEGGDSASSGVERQARRAGRGGP